MPKDYKINNLILLIKDEANVKFHLSQDDYFGTIATILSLIRQEIEKNPTKRPSDFKNTLNSLEKDLDWLQKNYQIIPRIKKKNKIPKGKEKNQCSNTIKTKREITIANEKLSRRPSRNKKKKKNNKAKRDKNPVSAKRSRKEL